ncbi:uncharacterized protein LOC108602880 [Drosophila busckii]|nr:uncharacterized protein LOC108602880 [Drosophila busckii]
MMNKDKLSDELLARIRSELVAIMEEDVTNGTDRKISYERLMQPTPLPTLEPTKKTSHKKKLQGKPSMVNTKTTFRQAVGGKSIAMKPTSERSSAGQQSSSEASTSSTSLLEMLHAEKKALHSSRHSSVEFMESPTMKGMDEDLQKMQLELKKSYELFQGIGEKLEAISFGGLKTRIRDLHLNSMANDLGKVTTMELQKLFESSYLHNRLDKLTADVSHDFRRHPGEFGDIPELSTFFQACSQLEHGLETLKQQRKSSSDLEKRLCWATEIAYDRMEEIRNAVGNKPKTNF